MLLVRVVIFASALMMSIGAPGNEEGIHKDQQLDPKLVRLLLSNDFESGSMEPWFDESPGETHWVLETLDSPQEPTPVPTPEAGKSHLRIDRPEGYVSGLGVLSTPLWTVNPGDKLSLSFWIRSRHTQGNTLDVYWINGTKEEKLLGLSSFSSSSNNQWRTAEATLPVTEPTNTKIVIYGFCGPNEEDSIAVDNIMVVPGNQSTTTSTVSHTVTSPMETTTQFPTYSTSFSPDACHYFLTGTDGYFGSPVGANGHYYDNLRCSWSITVPSWYSSVRIAFSSFVTEGGYDFVRIYDGPTTSSALLLYYSGTDIPSPVYSSTNQVLVTFTTDGSYTYPGFSAYFEGRL